MPVLNRRKILGAGILGVGVYGTATIVGTFSDAKAKSGKSFKIQRSTAEWKKRLGPARYRILRLEGTERAYSSPLNKEKRAGVFACAGCNLGLYSSKTKYDSRTGWPSFWAPIADNRIGKSIDHKIGYPRTEVHCARCGGHLGHIFNDGPRPTGKRHCINGLSLKFIPSS